jgi:hypothetical protein
MRRAQSRPAVVHEIYKVSDRLPSYFCMIHANRLFAGEQARCERDSHHRFVDQREVLNMHACDYMTANLYIGNIGTA